TADHISTPEAASLLQTCQQEMGASGLEFVPGVSYRNLLIHRGAKQPAPFTRDTRATPPHDLTDKSVADDFPRGPGSDLLNDLMGRSVAIFADHSINAARKSAGKMQATKIWLWGLGKNTSLTSFIEMHCKRGKLISVFD